MAKQVSNNLRKLLLNFKTTPKNYTGVLVNGRRISAYVANDPTTYATPQPALADVDAALDNIDLALIGKGTKYNRASKADIDIVFEMSSIAHGLVTQLIEYVLLTVSDLNLPVISQSALLIQAGSAARNRFAITGAKFLPPRDLKLVNTPNSPVSLRRFTWKKPQGQRGKKKPDSYLVARRDDDGNLKFIASVTKCSIDFPDGFPVADGQPFTMLVLAVGSGSSRVDRNTRGLPATITVPFIETII